MSHKLTLTNAAFNNSGKFGKSRSGGYGQASTPPITGKPGNYISFTMELWFKAAPGSVGGHMLFQQQGLQLFMENGWVTGKAGNEGFNGSSYDKRDGQWHHVAVYLDGVNGQMAGAQRFFIDGVLLSGTSWPYSSAWGNANYEDTPFFIGAKADGSAVFDGEMDEVVFTRGDKYGSSNFTPPTAPVSSSAPNLLALYHFDGDGADSAGRPETPIAIDTTNTLLPSPMVWVLGSTGMGHTSFGRAQQDLVYNGDAGLLSEDSDSWNILYSTTSARFTADASQNGLNNPTFTRVFAFEVPSDIGNNMHIWSASANSQSGYVKEGLKITITPQLKVDVAVPNIIQLALIENQISFGKNVIAVTRYQDGTSAISVNGNAAVSMNSQEISFAGGEMLGCEQFRGDWQQGLLLEMYAHSTSSVSASTLASLSGAPYQIVRTYSAPVAQAPGPVVITSIVKASTSQDTYQVNYQVPAANGGTTESIEFNITPGTAQDVGQFFDVSVDGAKLVNLNPNTTYTLTARAYSQIGFGPMSQPFVFTTQASGTAPIVDASTKPNPPGNVVATAGDGTVSVNWSAPSSDGGKPILDYTVLGSDGHTVTVAAPPATLAATNGSPVTYTVRARNVINSSDPSSASAPVTPLAAGAQPKPVIPGYRVMIYGDQPGDDFTNATQVAAWTGSQSTLLTDNGPFVVLCRKDIDLTNQQIGPGWSDTNNVGYMRPYPGMGYSDIEADNAPGNVTAISQGIKILLNGDSRVKVGLYIEGFNVIQTAGSWVFRRDGWGQGGDACGIRANRMLSTSSVKPIVTGEYANGFVMEDNLVIHDGADAGGILNSFSGNVKRNTFKRRGAGAGNAAITGNGAFIQDNIFSQCGGTPSTAGGGGDHNYTDTPTTFDEGAKIIYSPGQFFESANDARPAAGSKMINGASQFSISRNDANGNNRGTMPDAGAFQRTPATPLATGTITVQETDGATRRYSITTTNSPTSGMVTLTPQEGSTGAQAVGPVPLVLSPGLATLDIDRIFPGKYNATGTLTNGGGTNPIPGMASFEIAGAGGLLYDTGGVGNASDTPPPTENNPFPPPTLSIATPNESILSGNVAKVTVNANTQNDVAATVVYYIDPQPSGNSQGPFNMPQKNGTMTMQRPATIGKVKYRFIATANGSSVTQSTGEVETLTLNGTGILPI